MALHGSPLQAATPHLAVPCRPDLGLLLMNVDPTTMPARSKGVGLATQLKLSCAVHASAVQMSEVPPSLRSSRNLSPSPPIDWQLEAVCACSVMVCCPEVCLMESYASKRRPCSARDSWQSSCGDTVAASPSTLPANASPDAVPRGATYYFDHSSRCPIKLPISAACLECLACLIAAYRRHLSAKPCLNQIPMLTSVTLESD